MRILIVEDDIHIRVILCLTLKQFGQHEIEEATNGEEALKILSQEHSFDLILMDSMMPKKDGLQTLQEYFKIPLGQHSPIIFLSAKSGKEDIQKALDSGAIGYIKKPFDPRSICGQIEETLRKHKLKNLENSNIVVSIEKGKKTA